jgi:hypothetical protein
MNVWEELYIYKEICKGKEKLINEQINSDSARTYKRPIIFKEGRHYDLSFSDWA